MEILTRIGLSLQNGEPEPVAAQVREALDAGLPAEVILDRGLLAGMQVVGQRFRAHEIFLPDVLLAARAMYAGLDLLKPLLEGGGVGRRGTVVIGSVRGDLHDIGKNLVGIMLRGAGFEVVDLGNDVAPERFVDAAQSSGAGVIGMSALLTTTMTAMKEVVDLVRDRGLSAQVKTIVGGAPVTSEFARSIGADAHGYDAANAVDRISALLGTV
jgi:5-methyltetrahydrofolate--homocysteine methyltransferase